MARMADDKWWPLRDKVSERWENAPPLLQKHPTLGKAFSRAPGRTRLRKWPETATWRAMRIGHDSLLLLSLGLSRPWAPL